MFNENGDDTMKNLILTLMLIIPAFSYADSIYFGVYTTHFDNSKPWNNVNNLVAVEANDYVFASFINSHGFQTYMGGKEHRFTKNISAIYGVSYGYDIRCFDFVKGGCHIETYTANFLPAIALKVSHQIGPVSLAAIVADYVNISIGIDF